MSFKNGEVKQERSVRFVCFLHSCLHLYRVTRKNPVSSNTTGLTQLYYTSKSTCRRSNASRTPPVLQINAYYRVLFPPCL